MAPHIQLQKLRQEFIKARERVLVAVRAEIVELQAMQDILTGAPMQGPAVTPVKPKPLQPRLHRAAPPASVIDDRDAADAPALREEPPDTKTQVADASAPVLKIVPAEDEAVAPEPPAVPEPPAISWDAQSVLRTAAEVMQDNPSSEEASHAFRGRNLPPLENHLLDEIAKLLPEPHQLSQEVYNAPIWNLGKFIQEQDIARGIIDAGIRNVGSLLEKKENLWQFKRPVQLMILTSLARVLDLPLLKAA